MFYPGNVWEMIVCVTFAFSFKVATTKYIDFEGFPNHERKLAKIVTNLQLPVSSQQSSRFLVGPEHLFFFVRVQLHKKKDTFVFSNNIDLYIINYVHKNPSIF